MASPLLKVLHGYHNLCKVKHMQKFLQVFMSQGLDLQMLLKLFLVRVLFTGKVCELIVLMYAGHFLYESTCQYIISPPIQSLTERWATRTGCRVES